MLTFKSWTILVLVFQIIVVLVNNSIIKTGLNSVHAFNLPKPDRNIQSLRSFYVSDTNKPLPPSFKQINPEKLKRFQNRLINAFISTIFIALAANFLNITSFLLSSTSPDYFRSLKLDELYSIEGYRRYEDDRSTYQFIFPESWRIDTRLLQKRVQLNETPRELLQAQGINNEALPEIAYGRPDIKFKENLSIIKSRLSSERKNFLNSLDNNEVGGDSLINEMYRILGKPSSAVRLPDKQKCFEIADNILRTVIAPEGSGKTYRLINSEFNTRNNKQYFSFEYNLQKEGSTIPINQHTISLITIKGDYLYTFTVTSPEGIWDDEKQSLFKVAESFLVN